MSRKLRPQKLRPKTSKTKTSKTKTSKTKTPFEIQKPRFVAAYCGSQNKVLIVLTQSQKVVSRIKSHQHIHSWKSIVVILNHIKDWRVLLFSHIFLLLYMNLNVVL